jgi:hypothetical protein
MGSTFVSRLLRLGAMIDPAANDYTSLASVDSAVRGGLKPLFA